MKTENKIMLAGLIETGSDTTLSIIREGYNKAFLGSELSIEDEEICALIDDYFEAKEKVKELIPEKTIGKGVQTIEFEYKFFNILAVVSVSCEHSPATGFAPETNDFSCEIIDLTITI
jgi:hypothetical protein